MAGLTAREVRAGLDGLHRSVDRAVGRYWARVKHLPPAVVRDRFLVFTPMLVEAYGQAAATLAADWYIDLRKEAGVSGRFEVVTAKTLEREFIEARVRFGAGSLWTPEYQQFPLFIADASHGYVTEAHGETIRQMVAADTRATGWERITNAGACDFCVMLAGRGGVYKDTTVRFAAHSGCKCSAKPSWDESLPEVPIDVYERSERTKKLSPGQRARHLGRIAGWLENNM